MDVGIFFEGGKVMVNLILDNPAQAVSGGIDGGSERWLADPCQCRQPPQAVPEGQH
jgi:hypothetical protein